MSAAVRSAPLVLTRVFAWLALPILPQKESQPEAESTKDSEEGTPLLSVTKQTISKIQDMRHQVRRSSVR